MEARKHDTAKPAAAIAEPQPEPKKRIRSDGALAGALHTRLLALDAEEQAELDASPSEINAKYDARRERLLADATPEVRVLVERMLGK